MKMMVPLISVTAMIRTIGVSAVTSSYELTLICFELFVFKNYFGSHIKTNKH